MLNLMDNFAADVFAFSTCPDLAATPAVACMARPPWNCHEYDHHLPISFPELENNCSNLPSIQNLHIGSASFADSVNEEQISHLASGFQPCPHPGDHYSHLHHYPLSEDALVSAQLNKYAPELCSRNPSVSSQQHADHVTDAMSPGLQEVACEVMQRMAKGSRKFPKFDKSSSFNDNTCNGVSSLCQQQCSDTSQPPSATIRHRYSSGSLSPSLDFAARSSSYLPEAMPVEVYHSSKKLWSDEVCWQRLQECSYDARHAKQIRPYSAQSQSRASGNGGSATARPRTRARRGQATDPHSIAERLRRERIADRIKQLQELVPNMNKTDKISMLDDIIEYVKFLQLQEKVFKARKLMSKSSLTLAEDKEGMEGVSMAKISGLSTDSNIVTAEEEVAKLMEVNISSAMRFLQSKRLCLMPISMAAAISSNMVKLRCSSGLSKQTE